MKETLRLLTALVVAFAAAAVAFLLLGLLLSPLQRFDSLPAVFHGVRAALFFAEGFVFIFAGSLVMPPKWRLAGIIILLIIGVAFFIYTNGGESTGGLPVWHLAASVVGGLSAALVWNLTRAKKSANQS